MNLNFVKILFPTILLAITSCSLFGPPKALYQKHDEITQNLVMAYDEAITRMYIERLNVENQFIDLQKENSLMMLAYYRKTGIKKDDLLSGQTLTVSEYIDLDEKFKSGKLERIKQIQKDYAEFTSQMNKALQADAKLSGAISDIEGRRREMFGGFVSFLIEHINSKRPEPVKTEKYYLGIRIDDQFPPPVKK